MEKSSAPPQARPASPPPTDATDPLREHAAPAALMQWRSNKINGVWPVEERGSREGIHRCAVGRIEPVPASGKDPKHIAEKCRLHVFPNAQHAMRDHRHGGGGPAITLCILRQALGEGRAHPHDSRGRRNRNPPEQPAPQSSTLLTTKKPGEGRGIGNLRGATSNRQRDGTAASEAENGPPGGGAGHSRSSARIGEPRDWPRKSLEGFESRRCSADRW